jgi:predicted PurR-regulated permease PerM
LGNGLKSEQNRVAWQAPSVGAASRLALIGIFVLLFGVFLSLAQTILLPIVSALILGTMLAQITNSMARYSRWLRWLSAALLVGLITAVISFAIVLISDSAVEWIQRAPEIGARLREKLQVLERPLAALADLRSALTTGLPSPGTVRVDLNPNIIAPILAVVTPALGQLVLFFVTLFFFLIARSELRSNIAVLPTERETRLRLLHAIKDIERNLARYLTLVTGVNIVIGLLTAMFLFVIGFPNPIVFGMLAFILNYVPYLGPASMMFILFLVGLGTYPELGQSLIAPAGFLLLSILEGQFATPTIMGRELTINPFAIFISVAFWTWLWGPFGALLATPILIVVLVALRAFRTASEVNLPA